MNGSKYDDKEHMFKFSPFLSFCLLSFAWLVMAGSGIVLLSSGEDCQVQDPALVWQLGYEGMMAKKGEKRREVRHGREILGREFFPLGWGRNQPLKS